MLPLAENEETESEITYKKLARRDTPTPCLASNTADVIGV